MFSVQQSKAGIFNLIIPRSIAHRGNFSSEVSFCGHNKISCQGNTLH